MANPVHLGKLQEGVEAWNRWRRENPDILPYLREADLSRMDLSGADLGCSHLGHANLFSAILDGANLSGANLIGSDLSETDLNGATLAGAWAAATRFLNLDLRGVHGLDAIRHSGPSTVGIDTIYKSNGSIPHAFLRGCGVPEALITYIPSLVAAQTGIEYNSLFLSYSVQDHAFAERLSVDLEANGYRCWFSPRNPHVDLEDSNRAECSIQMHDKQLLVLSETSLKSGWVKQEIRKAYHRDMNDGLRFLYPISICSLEQLEQWHDFDSATGRDYAFEVRRRFIPNFTNWQDQYSYRQVLGALLRNLAENSAPLPSFGDLDAQAVQAVA